MYLNTAFRFTGIHITTMTNDSSLATSTPKKPIIALDCDGVLLNFDATYAQIYEKTFGKQLSVVVPQAYRVSLSSVFHSQTSTLLLHKLR